MSGELQTVATLPQLQGEYAKYVADAKAVGWRDGDLNPFEVWLSLNSEALIREAPWRTSDVRQPCYLLNKLY